MPYLRRRSARPLASGAAAALVLGAFMGPLARPLAAQHPAPTAPTGKTYKACYVASSGTVYVVGEPGTPAACGVSRKGVADVPVNLYDGGDALRTGSTAGGDVAGSFGALTVARLQGHAVAAAAPTEGQVLAWTGAAWAPTTAAAGGVTAHGQLSGLTAPADDHTQYLRADGVRSAPDGFAVTGTPGAGTLAASGPGTRLVWYPGQAAFRAGTVAGTQWDAAGIGRYSAAFGQDNTVSGLGGFAAGLGNACTGTACVAVGFEAKAEGQGAVAIGYRATANANYAVALGHRASADRYAGAFVWGDASTTDSVLATASNQFTVRARGGIRLRTSTATRDAVGVNGNTGCDIPGFSGSMSCASSRTVKEDFRPLEGEEVLARVRGTPVTSWSYIGEDAAAGRKVRHVGPMAEDFHAAFGLGINNTTIGHTDIAGVNFAGVQALEARTRALQAENAGLRAQLDRLEAALQRVEAAPRR
jgi:hypothetical protein